MLDKSSQSLLDQTQQRLKVSLAERDIPKQLRDAMSYSLLSGGKRIRALLCYAAGLALDAPLQLSLIHI